MKLHPVAELFPPMSADEFAALKADIQAHGVREAAWTFEGAIIDGRNRLKACEELGVALPVREWDGQGSMVSFVVSQNLHRRHLTSSQRAMLGAEVEPMLAEEAKKRQREHGRTAPGKKKSLEETVPQVIREDQSRDQAAAITGTNSRYVSDAKRIREADPELASRVKEGELTVPQARLELKRQHRREDLAAKAAAADAQPADAAPPWRIEQGDCLGRLAAMPAGCARLVFADPPYNIGLDYGEGHNDAMPEEEYLAWCESWMALCRDRLTHDGAMWALINDEWVCEFGVILKRLGLHRRNLVTWYETFGINCSDKFNRTKRHLFYCTKHSRDWVFHFDAVSRQSARQQIGDARANPAGKTLDDVWLDIPRLAGTVAERVPDFPTQLPLALLRRIIGCCTDPGDTVIDPFNGSGTTGVAAVELGRRYVGIERSASFAEISTLRLKGAQRAHSIGG